MSLGSLVVMFCVCIISEAWTIFHLVLSGSFDRSRISVAVSGFCFFSLIWVVCGGLVVVLCVC